MPSPKASMALTRLRLFLLHEKGRKGAIRLASNGLFVASATHLEWRRSMQELVSQDAQRPKVDVVPVRLCEDHLWRKVVECPAICLAASARWKAGRIR